MLHEFLTSNRPVIVDRCRVLVASRSGPETSPDEVVHGISTSFDQVIETLTTGQTSEHEVDKCISVRNPRGEIASEVGTTGACTGGIYSARDSRLNKLSVITAMSARPL
jgi:hypothetical protein